MSNIMQFLQNIRSQNGFKAKLRNRLFSSMIHGFEAIEADIGSINSQQEEIMKRLENLQSRFDTVEIKSSDCTGTVSALRNDLESIGVNLRNNNSAIDRLSADSEFLKLKISGMEKNLRSNASTVTSAPQIEQAQTVPQNAVNAPQESDYESIDYFDFENHFRGSIESIKKAQEFYLPYFKNSKKVIDIGCGRGEFLSLMKDNGIDACGVDIYEPYVDYCNMKGLSAVCGDGSEFLSKQDEVDGIFVGQVVEHLKTHEIIRLCNTAYEKLSEGGIIVIETPNPTSLAIYTNAFYIDPSHIKPVHPLTMRYYLEKAGFRKIDIIFTENSRPQFEIPELKISGGEDTEEFNKAMKKVSELLYGSQDYAVIACK